ncbi:SAM-dependent methyltransferase [Mycoplasmatota bacterium]|nr:SAM-dependent methyltransferase [Mycoplasmatota bacterium]
MCIQISKRLNTIALNVIPFRHVIDVGTDHCLVPIYLLLNNYIDDAIATDLNEGPINEAKKNIEHYNLENRVDTRCGNGLQTVSKKDPCDVIIVAGMGGKLITDILQSGSHLMHLNKRLILQPNVNEESVRQWLCENHYEIVNEIIIKEDNVFYEIIVANYTQEKTQYTFDEIKFGPLLLKDKNELFIQKWTNILKYKKEIYDKIPDHHKNKKLFLHEINHIEDIIK